ncbi:MAG: hypothetical protein AB1442_09115 [Nitrospirota bacterium]
MTASQGSGEELAALAHHPSTQVIERLLLNRNVAEDDVRIIARRRNVGTDILESIYYDRRWKHSYNVMLALCKNPKTPSKIALSILKSLRIFDLADLTRNRQVPVSVRIKAEMDINEKVLTLPLGIKITLAKRASQAVLVKLLEDGMSEVVDACLDSPIVTEKDICRIISLRKTSSQVIRRIALHPKWSHRYDVQWALMRNHHTPLSLVVTFLGRIKTTDLKNLYSAHEVPSSTKPFIYRELLDRGIPLTPPILPLS